MWRVVRQSAPTMGASSVAAPLDTADCIASEDAHNKTKATGPVARADPCLRRSRAVLGWEGAMIELDGIASVADVARVQALRRGNAPALLFDGRSTTFAEVDATASRLAKHLIASGVRPQERIAYLAKNSDHFLPFLLGVCKARVDAGADQFPPRSPGDRPHARRQRRETSVRRRGFRRTRGEGGGDARFEAASDRARLRSRRLSSVTTRGSEAADAATPAAKRPGRRRGPALHVRHDRPAQRACN